MIMNSHHIVIYFPESLFVARKKKKKKDILTLTLVRPHSFNRYGVTLSLGTLRKFGRPSLTAMLTRFFFPQGENCTTHSESGPGELGRFATKGRFRMHELGPQQAQLSSP